MGVAAVAVRSAPQLKGPPSVARAGVETEAKTTPQRCRRLESRILAAAVVAEATVKPEPLEDQVS